MKITKSILGVSIAALALASCNDKMDYNEYTVFDKDYIERSFYYVGGFMTTIYNDIDTDWGNLSGAMLSSATDESEYSHSGNTIENFYNGNWSPSNTSASISVWNSAYEGITYCNEFLDNWTDVDFTEYSLNSDYNKELNRYDNYKYEARWARAYFYYTLVRQYGSVPFKIHNSTSDSTLPNTSSDSIFTFINAECDSIKDKIIADYTKLGSLAPSTGVETGRASKYSVLALKAQSALYHASPLFTQGKSDEEKTELWYKAALANKECITQCEAGDRKLAVLYDRLWANNFYTNDTTYYETLFFRRTTASRTFESYNFPVGYSSGQGGNCPTQDLVDAYDMKATGLGINEEGSGYDPQNPYVGRDPRFEMTIAHNGDVWPKDIVNTDVKSLQTYEGGYHSRTGGASGASYATPTSYYLKKFCYPSQILRSGHQTTSPHGWMTFRLGGAYLNYAEAVFQYFKALGRTDAADATNSEFPVSARELASKTRVRAGMPAFKKGMSNDEFWTRYKKERQVELAFEGHRFYDVRRWMEDGDKFMNIHEMQIVRTGVDDGSGNITYTYTYTPVAVTRGDGQWQTKWNLFPFNQTEILKSSGAITQNPGW